MTPHLPQPMPTIRGFGAGSRNNNSAFTARLRPVALAAALLSAYTHLSALADLPRGAQLRFGQAQVQTTAPGQMTISQSSARAGLDWQSFSIGTGQSVWVQQPSANSVLVNRVVGSDPSLILGSLRANGSVWLLNPSGIVFGANAQVNVGGLVASTLVVRDGLQSGRLVLERGPNGAAALVADGTITAPNGTVVLAAPQLTVGPQAQIQAQRVGLAAATHVSVDVEGDGLMLFNVSNDGSLDTRLDLLGNASASAGGSVEARAAARAGFADTVLNLEGVVRARSLSTRQGQIVIDGGAAGTTRVAGHVDASGTNTDERGGQVQVLGQHIRLDTGANINASGPAGGGTVLVGGDWQGSGNLPQATTVTMQADTHIDASATQQGDGGKVVLWSDVKNANSVTRAEGHIQAKGVGTGSGGQVETSGHSVDTTGLSVNAGAEHGASGLWLIDPHDYTISDAASINTSLNNGTNVTIDTANATSGSYTGISGDGNITINANIEKTGNPAATLTLNATNYIQGSGNINNSGNNALDMVFNAGGGTGTYSGQISNNVNITKTGAGNLTLSGNNTYTGTTTITGGTLQVGNGSTSGTLGAGAVVNNATLTFNRSDALTVANEISGSGDLTKTGSGTLTLSGSNTYSGATTVSAGTLAITHNNALGTTAAGTTVASGATLDLQGVTVGAEAITLNGGTLSTSFGASSIFGNVTLGANADFSVTGNSLNMTGAVNGPYALNVTGSGALTLAGGVGQTTALTSLAIAAPVTLASNITTSGAQTYTGAVTLSSGNRTLTTTNTASDNTNNSTTSGITFSSTINSETGQNHNLSLAMTSGTATFGGAVGATNALGAIDITGKLDLNAPITAAASLSVSDSSDLGANVTTSGAQTYSGAVTLSGGNRTLTTTDSNITFSSNSTINSETGQNRNLTLAMGTGTATFGGAVGATNALGAIDITGALDLNAGITSAASLSVSGSSDLGANVTTSGAQTYSGAVTLSGGNRTLTTTDSNITFSNTVDSANSTARALTLAMGTGTATFGGAVGATNALGAIAVTGNLDLNAAIASAAALSVSGSSDLGANVTTSGAQTYSGAVTLSGGNRTLTTTDSNITFSNTVDSANSTARNLTLAMGTGTATFGGAVGATNALGAIDITGALDLNAGITSAASLSVSGSSDLGANVTTSGTQSYTGAVTVSADSIVTGSHITMQALALESGGFGHQLSVANTDTASAITSVISGAGGLTKTGAGTLTLSGNNTYTGGTTVYGGTLALDTSGTIAASSGVTIHNAGTFSIAGDKTLRSLSSASTTATTSLSNFTLTVGDASDTLSTVSTYAGAISGTGSLTKTGAGTLTLLGNNAYAGTTTVSRGTLQVGNGSTSGTLGTGAVINNATLTFNRSDALTVANEISGSGDLTKTGSGTLTLSGPNTYSGATTVNAGTLVLTGTLNNASHVNLTGTSVWDLRTTQTVASLNMGSGTSITNGAGISALTVTGTSTLANRINTSGTQTYRSAVTLGADVTLTASTVNTQSTLAGNNNALAIVGAANIGGAYTGLSSLNVSGASTLGANISTTGTQTYAGAVTLSGADRSLTGSTVNTQSTLAGGGHALAIVGAANIGGAYTGLSSLNVSGASTLGANISTTGTQTYQGAVTLINGDRTLTGSAITANNAGNLWGSVLSLTATDAVNISGGNGPLTLGSVTAGAGGSIRAGTVHLNDQMTVRSGTLTLLASADASGNTTNSNKLSPTQTSVYYSADVVTQGTNGKIDVEQGARLVVLAPGNSANGGAGGSVALTHADNRFAGELEILSGAANATWSDHLGNGQSVQGRVQVNGSEVRIGGAGIEADIVSVRANQLFTLVNAVIAARMPFNNAMEASATVPGLTLALAPGAFSLASPFGRTGAEIAVSVGYGSSFNTGLLSALPQNGAQGATAVVLKGPAIGNGYTFYSTNAGIQSEIPVYYNGLMPSTPEDSTNAGIQTEIPVYRNGLMPSAPEVSGAISATTSVIENARRQGFEEALRTENVATRLRSGVIAEVGPGRSATTGSKGIALPELCNPGVTGDCNGEEK